MKMFLETSVLIVGKSIGSVNTVAAKEQMPIDAFVVKTSPAVSNAHVVRIHKNCKLPYKEMMTMVV